MNFDNFARFTDAGNMLQWFEDELKQMEKNGEQAIVLSHVPNGDECLRQYGRRYHALLDKYQHVIRWTVSSHVHREKWSIVNDI